MKTGAESKRKESRGKDQVTTECFLGCAKSAILIFDKRMITFMT